MDRAPGKDVSRASASSARASPSSLPISRQTEIDRAIAGHLAVGWKLERIDATLRALFRAAVFELMTGAAKEIVIDEYVEIAKSFFEGPEPGFVNAALDALARDLPHERS